MLKKSFVFSFSLVASSAMAQTAAPLPVVSPLVTGVGRVLGVDQGGGTTTPDIIGQQINNKLVTPLLGLDSNSGAIGVGALSGNTAGNGVAPGVGVLNANNSGNGGGSVANYGAGNQDGLDEECSSATDKNGKKHASKSNKTSCTPKIKAKVNVAQQQ